MRLVADAALRDWSPTNSLRVVVDDAGTALSEEEEKIRGLGGADERSRTLLDLVDRAQDELAPLRSSIAGDDQAGLRQVDIGGVEVIGICVFAEMSGRLVAVSGRPVHGLIHDKLGPRVALANLVAAFLVTLLTLTAQIGGVALVIELASGIPHVVWIVPVVVCL